MQKAGKTVAYTLKAMIDFAKPGIRRFRRKDWTMIGNKGGFMTQH
ncbi:hypothetical protein ACFO4P_17235 [Epilithonimonas pallida]|nr:hypothetical protein [Epilithonimonas pallida]